MNKTFRRTYFNGTTYAIRAMGNDMLFICMDPEGPAIMIKSFAQKESKSGGGYAIELYLNENGYKPV